MTDDNTQEQEQQAIEPTPHMEKRDLNVALSLEWCLGMNKDITGGVHSLDTNGNESIMFYSAAHTGVVYDYNRGSQQLLQGHINPISATTVSRDKQWVITADRGQDSMMVVWAKENDFNPVKTIFNPHANGVLALDITWDGKYLVTLSAPSGATGSDETQEGVGQEISIWDWMGDTDGPLCTATIGAQDLQTCVLFNDWDTHEIATNGKRRVFFWTWDVDQPFQFYSPALSARDFKQNIADFTQTIFLPESTQAATATVDGDVVVWDLSLIVDGLSRPDERRAVKIVHLFDHPINTMFVHSPFVVVGGADGAVRFYDYQFRVQAWFEDLSAGPVKSISFALQQQDELITDDDEGFKCPHFLVATSSALVILAESSIFERVSAAERRGRLVLQGLDGGKEGGVFGLSCHPGAPHVAVCGLSGFLHVWNYKTQKLLLNKFYDKMHPAVLEYSPCGKSLAVGFSNGFVKILRSSDLSDIASWRDKRAHVSHIAWSPNSDYLAVALAEGSMVGGQDRAAAGGSNRCICLYKFAKRHEDDEEKEWQFSGNHRAHTKTIVGICFSGQEDGEELKLFSVGEDRKLVEFNVRKSHEFSGLKDESVTVIEQEARPTGCLWYPFVGGVDKQNVLTMNDEYKFKVWNARNKSCRKTAVMPLYGGPVCKMQVIPKTDASPDANQFVVYSSVEKILGVLQLPLDGNPLKSQGLIAHPGQIPAVSVSYDGKYVFTCGGPDHCVNQWELNTNAVEESAKLGGNGIEPYVQQLDGGETGEFFADMKDYFYYSQIRSQDEDTTKARKLDGMIPVSEIEKLMAALGYYPSDLEITNMANEVEYMHYTESGQKTDRIGFQDFVKLYMNHRPVAGISSEDIEQAFLKIANEGGSTRDFALRERLIEDLTQRGEKMSEAEIKQCLQALKGDGNITNVFPDEKVDSQEVVELLGFEDEVEDEEYEGEHETQLVAA